MPLETGDYIADLVETNPPGTDNVSQGDDHLRLIKHVLKTTFPNIDGPVTSTDEELSNLGGGMPIVTTYSSPATATHTFGVGMNWYRVIVTGGGGGGYDGSIGGAGSAGGTAIKVAQITTVDATYTVGAAGAVNAAGGDSSFIAAAETITGGGGSAGLSDRDNPVEGGIGTGGDINIRGGGPTARQNDSSGGISYWGGGNATTASGAFGTGGKPNNLAVPATEGISGVVIIEEY